jgi:protein O-GlcNAc transferase
MMNMDGMCEAEEQPDMARYHFEKGLEHFTRGDFHNAVQLFRRAVRIDNQQAEYHRHLALALSRNPMWGRRAEEALLRAIELEPDHAETHYFLGRIYIDSGRPARALERFEESLRLNPELEPARLELSVMDGAGPVEERELVSASLFDRD